MTKATLDAETNSEAGRAADHQHAHEIQPFGHLVRMPNLNQLLADTMTLRDLYKKHHWQIAGPTFYQLHLLFDNDFTDGSGAPEAESYTLTLPGTGVTTSGCSSSIFLRPMAPSIAVPTTSMVGSCSKA